MKKTIVVSVLAVCFSVAFINATPTNNLVNTTSKVVVLESSPFHMSIVKGDLETVKKLIELGADVNKKWNGLTPAMYAAKFNRTNVLSVLIESGANLKLECDKGHTALEYAEMSNAQGATSIIKNELEK